MKTVKARIVWTLPEMGGRKLITIGVKYAIPARFEDESDKWPREAWSLVAELSEPPNSSLETIATVWLLAGDDPNAPNHLLRPGSRFDLLDGANLIARGEVLC
jgi:hypothetical protein